MQGIKKIIALVRESKFARDATYLFIFNVTAKIILFFGNMYAAKCLGPVNLGISAQIQALVQQTSLVHNGGFDIVAVREIANNRNNTDILLSRIILFRVLIATFTSIIWIVFVFSLIDTTNLQLAWFFGGILLLFSSLNITFLFQGLEKLPIQSVISIIGALITAGAYYFFFTPEMFIGADLIVIAISTCITISASWGYWFLVLKIEHIKKKLQWRIILRDIKILLTKSWRYWLLAIVVFCYSVFQIPLIGFFLGDREAGLYRSAFVITAGIELLFNSINSLLLPRLIFWKKMGLQSLWKRQAQLARIFILIGFPPVILLILNAQFIYSVFLGEMFNEGVLIFQILLFGRLVVFIGQIYAWGLVAIRQDFQLLYATVIGAVFSVLLTSSLITFFGLVAAAIVSVFSEILVHFSCYFFQRKYMLSYASI